MNDVSTVDAQVPKVELLIDNRKNNFNALRLFAAVLVIYGHMHALLNISPFIIMGTNVSTIAVEIFFTISGFLICESWKRDPDFFRYTTRRAMRIIPGLIFVVLITAFIIGPIVTSLSTSEYFANARLYNYLKCILLNISYDLPGVFVTNPYPVAVNGSLWSLPVEVLMYVFVPILCIIGLKSKKMLRTFIVFTAIVIAANLFRIWFAPDFRIVVYGMDVKNMLSLAPFFYIGSLFSFPQVRRLLNLQVAFAAILMAVLISWPSYINEIVVYLVVPYSVMAFALTDVPLFHKIGSQNDYSYGLYLWGFLIQQLTIWKLGPNFRGLNTYFAISLIISYLCAVVSWHLIEKPAQKLSKILVRKMRTLQHSKS